MEDVWVVVPMYNEATTVGAVVTELRRSFTHVLCVDDGSSDHGPQIARAAGAVVITHAVNLGQGAALQTGFDYVRDRTDAEFCVTFDADGQYLVEDAERLVHALRETNLDVALATRRGNTSGMPRMRALVLRAGLWFTRRTTGLDITDTHNGLRVLRRSAFSRIQLRQCRMAHASELLSALTSLRLTYVEVPASMVYTDYSRTKGQGNINAVNIMFDLALERMRAHS